MDEAGIRAIEERSFNAWPALRTVISQGWVFRFSEGFTRRANSVNALAPVGHFADTLRLAEALYAKQGLPTIFRLSPLAGEEADDVLARAGYRQADETLVMTMQLDADCGDGMDLNVVIRSTPDPAWSEGFATVNGVSAAKRKIHDRMLASIQMETGFAMLVEDGRPIAYGLAIVECGMVGLFDIVTTPDARRRGAAQRTVGSLLAWGHSRGATGAYVQVVAANEPAVGLYAGFGYREAYRYVYRMG